MTQDELLEQASKQGNRFDLGKGDCLSLPLDPRSQSKLYFHGAHIKRVNLADNRLFAIDLLQKKISPSTLVKVFKISRQTMYNYRESYRMFGVNGLLNGYRPSRRISRER